MVVSDRYGDRLVRGIEGLVGNNRRMSVSHAAGIHPRDKVLLGTIGQPGELAFEKRRFNRNSPAGYGSLVKRSQNCVAREQPANDVCNCHSRLCRLALLVTRDTHEATARLNQEVVPWLV